MQTTTHETPAPSEVATELSTILGGLGILTIQAMPLALPGLILLLPLVLPLLVIGLVALPFWLLYRAVRALARRVPRGREDRIKGSGLAFTHSPSHKPAVGD